jgi:hypothetical protein
MSLFQKVEREDGTIEYVEANLAEIELPEDHPVQQKLKKVTQESIQRRKKLKEVVTTAAQPDEDRDGQDGDEAPQQPVSQPVIDIDAITAQIEARLTAKAEAERNQRTEREKQIDSIMSDTGLLSEYRDTIEVIPDLKVARATAAKLAQSGLRFDNTPSGGNGTRTDKKALFSAMDKQLFGNQDEK